MAVVTQPILWKSSCNEVAIGNTLAMTTPCDGAGAVLGVLQQSLAGWDALETDLLEAANLTRRAAQLTERVRSATQVVVDAILELLDLGVFR